MNAGAESATGEILYFLHADTRPPESFPDDILRTYDQGYEAGCYRFSFDRHHPMLAINAWFTRFDLLMCRGGDQSLFISRELFHRLGGFRDEMVIMEDYDLISRIRNHASFRILPKTITVSARKYKENSYLLVNLSNLFVFMLYLLGASQRTLIHAYTHLIKHPKFARNSA